MSTDHQDHGAGAAHVEYLHEPEGGPWAKGPADVPLAHAPIAYRPGQLEAVEEIVARFAAGARAVFLDAPVGAGKSLIHLQVARRLGGAYITTPQVGLVDQYRVDTDDGGKFVGLGVTVAGRRNYPCDLEREEGSPDATAEGAPCISHRGGFLCPVQIENRCAYYSAVAAAQTGPTTMTTLAFFIAGIRPRLGTRKWPTRRLLILDEAHGLVSGIVDHFAIAVGRKTLPGVDFGELTGAPDRLAYLREILPVCYAAVEARLNTLLVEGTDRDEIRRLSATRDLVGGIRVALGHPGVRWVYRWDDDKDAHTWRPLDVGPLVAGLWGGFDRVLLSSGTFVAPHRLAAELGLPGPVTVVRVSDTFPAERAPIVPVGSVRLSRGNLEESVPAVVAEICRIAALHPGERGLVHCHSYALSRRIVEGAPPELRRRIVVHGRGDRHAVYADWIRRGRPASVFLAVGMTEGIDLAQDLARWQVVVKAPYPDLGDPWVAGRLDRPGGREWYESETLTSILQAAGRVMRSADDRGITYVLDRNAVDLVRRRARELPAWFRGRLA